MFLKKTSVAAILLLVCSQLMAQDYDEFFFGKLIDATTGNPVVFATVRVKGKALGVISNNDGGFKIPREFQFEGDSLVLSSMGYESKEIAFEALLQDTINQIRLNPSVFELTETVVTARKNRDPLRKAKVGKVFSPRQIIKFAIERIPLNYDLKSYEIVGYYRDYQLREKDYINLNEAIIKVFDSGFEQTDYSSLKFGLYQYRPNLDFVLDSLAAKPYDYDKNDKYVPRTQFSNRIVPNELVLLFNHDALRHHNELSYSFVDKFVKDFVRNHDFLTYFLTNYGDKKVYKIKFEKRLTRFEVKGNIYIDAETYAIRKLDYAVYGQGINGNFKSDAYNQEMDLLYEVLVEYKEHEGLMYLNYISFHNKFKLVRPPNFYIEKINRLDETKEVIIRLNKPAKNWYALKPKDFNFYYGSTKLRVDGLTQVNVTTYKLEFSKNNKFQRKKVRQFFRESGSKKEKPIVLDISNMIDFEGYRLGKENSELLDQYREFFTQKVTAEINQKAEHRYYIDKDVSLSHPEQPKLQLKTDEDFWMNTPFKTNPQQ